MSTFIPNPATVAKARTARQEAEARMAQIKATAPRLAYSTASTKEAK